MNQYLIIIASLFALCLTACEEEIARSDAYGNFEASSTIVSAEANGRLLFLNVAEGQQLKKGKWVALVDTSQLHLQKLQLLASIKTLPKKLRDAAPDIAVLEDQKRNLLREQKRLEQLVAAKAATPKQLDDLNGEIVVIEQRIKAAGRQTTIANRGILAEQEPLRAQITALDNQIHKCYIYNPIDGTVLTELASTSEVVGFGSPLYKIANLDYLELRAYASGVQLQEIQLGQEVQVLIDAQDGQLQTMTGTIIWISDQAEFTPKTIQTKEERVNLVYAFKVKVANKGQLKIGMPAEVMFQPRDTTSLMSAKKR